MLNIFFAVGKQAICIAIITAALFAQPVAPQHNQLPDGKRFPLSKSKQFEKVMDAYVTEKIAEDSATGLSIVVVENNRVIYEKGFGYADRENGVPVEPTTLFHLGSITKVFTGIGIMQLAQKGKLDIDAPIQQYLPDFSIKYHLPVPFPVTIRSIMAHQSGIFVDKIATFFSPEYPEEDFRTYPEFAKNEFAPYSPNYITSYSNFAVSLLGLIIEQVSGQKYEEYIYNNILKPCGMWESGFDPKIDHPQLFAKGYNDDGSEYPYYYIADVPAGFLASSSSNMANFIRMILNNGCINKKWILYPNTLYDMYQPHSTYLPMNLYDDYMSPYNFGLSWMLENRSHDYLGKIVGHGGNLPPYNSKLLIAKDAAIGVFVTANKNSFFPDEIAYHALEQAGKIFKNRKKPKLPELPPVTTLPEHLKKVYPGTYTIFSTTPIEIYSENDTFFFHPLHAERMPLYYHTDDWMSLVVNNTIEPGVRFAIRILHGQKVLCIENRNEQTIHRMVVGNSYTPHDALLPGWQARMGTYADAVSGEPTIMLYTDQLSRSNEPFLSALSLGDYSTTPLNPFGNANLLLQGLGRNAQETVYFNSDTAHYSGYTFIKMEQPPMERSFAAEKLPQVKSQTVAVQELKSLISKSLLLR